MTNTGFSLKTYHEKITALKHKSTARRQALAQQQHGGHSHKGLRQQITTRHICALTLKSHMHQTLANNVNDNRK